jgi:type III restriction enzyme
MTPTPAKDRQRFRNEDLVLQVTTAIDRARWDESRYEGFLDELCGSREYQKEAIRTAMRYLLGGEYKDLKQLASSNFEQNATLTSRYGTLAAFVRNLQLPDRLSASLDLATGTGKSYVLYGISAIMLAEGVVDRVLLLCPSTTIEFGLTDKFKELASDSSLRETLPPEAKVISPQIINANDTIVESAICIENYHAILEHVGSSIRTSLKGIGSRVLVLNDEAHHVANESDAQNKKWKSFLLDPEFGFRYIVGVSGTCYVGNDYFADVIFRYSLREAMEQRYVKKVDYVAEMPKTSDPDEHWQLVHSRHENCRKSLKSRKIRPLTIVVTATIASCKDVGDELKHYLIEHESLTPDQASERVLIIHSNAPDLLKLPYVDLPASKVEWIAAVSMLNEGWDVKRVFQIVPHEERAFNSKLLISQVLGRGLRIPENWNGEQPVVTVFNHVAWADRIRELVKEVLEIEKRISSEVIADSAYHFDLLNIDYTLQATSVKKPMEGEYTLFAKGFVDLATESVTEDISVEFEQAGSGERYKWKTKIKHTTYPAEEIAQTMYERLEQAQDSEHPDPKVRTTYTDKFPVKKLTQIVTKSLERIGVKEATESMRQKFLISLGTLRRKDSENVRYSPIVNRYRVISTQSRPAISASAGELRVNKTVFYTEKSKNALADDQTEFFDEIIEPGSGFKCINVTNHLDFKTPVNVAIADYENERRFIYALTDAANVDKYDAWIKSSAVRFYEIDYAWKKGEHPKRGRFSPDFFIKVGDLIVVVEVKGDEELAEPSEENTKKNEYALAHFERLNAYLEEQKSSVRYKFTFITEKSFNKFFQSLRDGNLKSFRSELDVKLSTE